MNRLARLLIGAIFIATMVGSCTSYEGRQVGSTKLDGWELCGYPIYTAEERILTPEEHEEELRRAKEEAEQAVQLEAERREAMFGIESKEKRRTVLLTMSTVSYALAILSVVAGALLSGYKTFGLLMGVLMILGTVFLSLVIALPIFTWALIGAIVAGIFRVLYLFKHRGYGGEPSSTVEAP